ncbi:MAG TPA: SRPBCC family protein [Mycobacteriales bacterium]|nr:SRPBCC family protein [Mycobacteriales bacterium]
MTAEIRNDVIIVATEHIKAPPEVVFGYFTDPALIVTWIGERAELDPRPGGVFWLDMGEVVARGAYITVEPPHRVVFSWGVPGRDAMPPGGSTVEVVLTPDGDDTMVVLTHRGLPSTHIGDHRAGWEHRLARLRLAAG